MKVGVLATTILTLMIGFPIAAMAGLAPDGDNDGVPDVIDKCEADSRNVGLATCDTDTDGYGNVCDPDYDQSNTVNATDFTMFFLPDFQSGPPPVDGGTGTDMDCSGSVNATDFTMFFLPVFQQPIPANRPGPSGLTCAGTPGCN